MAERGETRPEIADELQTNTVESVAGSADKQIDRQPSQTAQQATETVSPVLAPTNQSVSHAPMATADTPDKAIDHLIRVDEITPEELEDRISWGDMSGRPDV